MLYYENKARKKGFKFIIGVDEAGRGPLAGPVVASAVFLENRRFKNRIADSKKLSKRQRDKAYHEIVKNSVYGLGMVSEAAIDEINILQATRIAMQKAVNDLLKKLHHKKGFIKSRIKKHVCALIDGGSLVLDIPCHVQNIIKGDSKSLSIACASIVAKVSRDRMMTVIDKIHPEYGFSRHQGYGTKAHLKAISRYGPSVFHRKSFAPIKCLKKKSI